MLIKQKADITQSHEDQEGKLKVVWIHMTGIM
jgi:hypothetical protein